MLKTSDTGMAPLKGSTQYWLAFLAAICSLLAAEFYETLFQPISERFSGDSASYIEAARSLLRDGSINITPWGYDPRLQPVSLQLWPPGYPALIAVLAYFGLSVQHAAILVAQWSGAFAAAAIVLIFSPIIGPFRAFLSASLIIVSPAILFWSFIPSSDLPFLLLVIIAIGALLRAMAAKTSLLRWLEAGLLSGITMWLRNAAVALIAAQISVIAIYGGWTIITDRATARVLLKGPALFVAAMTVPLLLLGYFNLYHFGTPFPYAMGPSQVGLITNVQNYVAAQFHEISGLYLGILKGPAGLGRPLAVLALVVLVAGAGAICLMLLVHHPRELEVYTLVLLGLYVLFGIATVIAARTRYELGDNIGERHAMQYSWAFAIVGFVLISWLPKRYRRYAQIAAVATLLGFAVLKLESLGQLFRAEQAGFAATERALGGPVRSAEAINDGALGILYARDSVIRGALGALPKNAIIFTNFPDLLRVHLEVAARFISDEEIAGGAIKLRDFAKAVGQRSQIYVVVLLSSRLLDSAGQDWQEFVTKQLSGAFSPIQSGNVFLIAKGLAVTPN